MANLLRSVTKKFFIISTVLVSVIFLIACLAAYLNPATWWPIGFLSLGVPYLLIALLFAFIFWLVVRAKYALVPLLAMAIGYNQILALLGFNFNNAFKEEKDAQHFRLISWNVGNLVGVSNNKERKKHIREEIADAVQKLDADVVCLQEFNHSRQGDEMSNNLSLFVQKYPHYYFSKDVNKENGYEYGSVIFSKHPILDSGRTVFKSGTPGSLAYVDVSANNDTIRVFTTHLQSFRFNSSDYADMKKISKQDDETLSASKNIFRKMRYAFTKRGEQAELVRKELERSPHPRLFCGDLNDVPNSFTYFHIRGDLQDAFLQKSFGIGRTFIALAPTLRIDYIMADRSFYIHQFEMVDEELSDHMMLVSDLSLKK